VDVLEQSEMRVAGVDAGRGLARNPMTVSYGRVVEGGHKEQSVTETASNAPAMATGSDPLWVRITSDGTTDTARVLAQSDG
jgi:hypothetical protein